LALSVDTRKLAERFVGRRPDRIHRPRRPHRRPVTPKYLNTPDTAIYHKGTLYGLDEQRDRIAAEWAPVIVEGPVDVLAVWLAHPDDHPASPRRSRGRYLARAISTGAADMSAATTPPASAAAGKAA
jgi:hypothetical protein